MAFRKLAAGERPLHAFEYGFHRLLGFGFGDSGLVHDFIDEIELDHLRLRLTVASRSLMNPKLQMVKRICGLVKSRSSPNSAAGENDTIAAPTV